MESEQQTQEQQQKEQQQEEQQQQQQQQEQQQQQIFTKLGELPIVSDTCAQVCDLYQRAKGCNALFRTSFGLAEYTAKKVADKAVPIVSSTRLQSHIDKVNDLACNQLDALEEKYPIIGKPTDEVLREGQAQYDKVKPYVDPLVVKPAKMAVGVGQAAVNAGTALASKAASVGSAATSSVLDTGKQAVSNVATGVLTTGQKVVDAGMSTPLGQFWTRQFDAALDATEKMVLDFCLPPNEKEGADKEDGVDKEEGEGVDKEGEGADKEEAGTRAERVRALVQHIHNALYQKAVGDLVRYRMMAGNLLHQIMDLTGFYATLMKERTQTAWKDRQDAMDAIDRVWNEYAQYIPEAARSEDPMKRMVVVLGTLTEKLGELFASSTELKNVVSQNLSHKCQEFVDWCQQSKAFLKESGGGADNEEKSSEFISHLTAYFPNVVEMVTYFSDNTVASLDVFGIVSKLKRQGIAGLRSEKKEEMEMDDLQAKKEEVEKNEQE